MYSDKYKMKRPSARNKKFKTHLFQPIYASMGARKPYLSNYRYVATIYTRFWLLPLPAEIAQKFYGFFIFL